MSAPVLRKTGASWPKTRPNGDLARQSASHFQRIQITQFITHTLNLGGPPAERYISLFVPISQTSLVKAGVPRIVSEQSNHMHPAVRAGTALFNPPIRSPVKGSCLLNWQSGRRLPFPPHGRCQLRRPNPQTRSMMGDERSSQQSPCPSTL